MSEYTEHFITTFTGKKFHFLDPQPEEIDIRDIAHALSLKCRYSGHCFKLYSVGDHSLRVSEILDTDTKLLGLMHDATEAYWPDVAKPMKIKFGLSTYEDMLWKVIKKRFDIKENETLWAKVKLADNIMLATEARDLMPNMIDWDKLPNPSLITLVPRNSTEMVENMFISEAKRLGLQD